MTTINPGSGIQRVLRIHGVSKPVNVRITDTGIEFWVKGHRKRATISWYQVVQAAHTPMDVPSFLMGKPMELLQHQAREGVEICCRACNAGRHKSRIGGIGTAKPP